MTSNEQLLTRFYNAFRNKDYKTMQDCYAEDATFSDEVFVDLNANEVRYMWKMLCIKGKDLQIEHTNVKADETAGSIEWQATYSFSKTNRKVSNRIKAEFTFSNGKIKIHRDHFNFHTWSRQALGLTGLLFGWTGLLKQKIRSVAKKNLLNFIEKEKQ